MHNMHTLPLIFHSLEGEGRERERERKREGGGGERRNKAGYLKTERKL